MTEERIKLITQNTDNYDDICYAKRVILDRLRSDTDLLEILNNSNLDINAPDDFINVNLFSHLVNPTNKPNEVSNYVSFEVNDNSVATNDLFVNKNIIFLIGCDQSENNLSTKWGDRHDVIGAIIKDLFNWSNLLGVHIIKTSDIADVTKIGIVYRQIEFTTVSLNGLTKGVAQNAHDKRS